MPAIYGQPDGWSLENISLENISEGRTLLAD
jgi:hypothetical protein